MAVWGPRTDRSLSKEATGVSFGRGLLGGVAGTVLSDPQIFQRTPEIQTCTCILPIFKS